MGERKMKKPNIVIILCDDLGYGDLGCYGNRVIKTPHIDALSEEGIRFTNFYAAAAWCMPSRKGLMTGVHPYKGGLNEKDSYLKRTYLSQMLKAQGYDTAALGKWHLGGMGDGLHPLDKGFDYFFGTPGSNDPRTISGQIQVYETFKNCRDEMDWPVPLIRGRETIENPTRQSQFTRRYTEEAQRIIKEHKDSENPFFIYLAHNMPHAPLFASEKFVGKSKGGIYGDVVEEIDWSVGEIRKTLAQQGMSEDTLIMFMSDNGPWTMFKEFGGTTGVLRGEKGTGWEGGPRVPSICCWPGHISPEVNDEFIVSVDLYATFAKLSGCALKEDQAVDSIDMSNVLFNQGKSTRENYLFFSGAQFKEAFALRSDSYKIHFSTNDRSRNPDTCGKEPAVEHDPPLLYNLDKDIGERDNIASEHPKVLSAMTDTFFTLSEEIYKTWPDVCK
jgi:arylsulfatase A